MPIIDKYEPQTIFGENEAANIEAPRVLIAPNRYVQGQGVLVNLGRYLEVVPSNHPAILISERGRKELGEIINESLNPLSLIHI